MDPRIKDILIDEMEQKSTEYINRNDIYCDLVKIGGRFRDARKAMGVSQKFIGDEIGITHGAISGVECGTYKGRYFRVIAMLAEYYEIELDTLLE